MRGLLNRLSTIGIPSRVRPAQRSARRTRVSVVIPCYNYGHYLAQCISSALDAQPDVEIEVLIVDDKSTDDSLEVALALASRFKQVRVLANEKNMGAIATYNRGLASASGEFAVLLSADDLLTPGSLTRAAALLDAEPTVGMVYGNVIRFEDSLPPSRVLATSWVVWRGVDWLRERCRSGYNVVASPEVMLRMSTLRSVGYYRPDLPHAGDFEMWMRVSVVSDVAFLLDVDQAYYRQHTANMHKGVFKGGTERGRYLDLEQRWKSFEAVFSGIGNGLPERDQLFLIARRTIARQAMELVNYAHARRFRDFPFQDFKSLAVEVSPEADGMKISQAFALRRNPGVMSLALSPFWAISALAFRLVEFPRRWRRRRMGI